MFPKWEYVEERFDCVLETIQIHSAENIIFNQRLPVEITTEVR